jgi:hypothetical protein
MVHDVERVQLSPDWRVQAVSLGNMHKTFLLQLTTAQRSGGCKLINGRRADLLHHAEPNQIRNN